MEDRPAAVLDCGSMESLPATFDNVLIERYGRLVICTINRPHVLNALDSHTLRELHQLLSACRHDDTVRTVIITGAGDRSFVAGADINELAELSPRRGREYVLFGQRVFDLVEDLGKPVIAAINGYALGGGCELALACTIRIAADTAKLGLPEINLGLMPGYGGTQRLTRLVGRAKAMELALTGSSITAAEGLAIGLVNRVVPPSELMMQARSLGVELSEKAPIATQFIMQCINAAPHVSPVIGAMLEATHVGLLTATEDMREGTRAFLEKRKAAFTGR